uniref:SMP-LTD domain-containing protein n=1 Tax=Gongylonema pulchrum TaxID=637853 RepID=A0A183EVV5_9BILA
LGLEKAAYGALMRTMTGFMETRAVSNASTNNSEVPVTPPLERIRITLSLKNSMDIPLLLRKIHLEVSADPTSYMQSFVDEFSLEATSDWIPLEFAIVPNENVEEIRVKSLLFELVVDSIGVACSIPLFIRGPRLFSSKKEVPQNLVKTYTLSSL